MAKKLLLKKLNNPRNDPLNLQEQRQLLNSGIKYEIKKDIITNKGNIPPNLPQVVWNNNRTEHTIPKPQQLAKKISKNHRQLSNCEFMGKGGYEYSIADEHVQQQLLSRYKYKNNSAEQLRDNLFAYLEVEDREKKSNLFSMKAIVLDIRGKRSKNMMQKPIPGTKIRMMLKANQLECEGIVNSVNIERKDKYGSIIVTNFTATKIADISTYLKQ
jgi:hypothetical protein